MVKEERGILHPTYNKRIIFYIISDIILFFVSLIISFAIRIGVNQLVDVINEIIIIFVILTILRILFFSLCRLYTITWKYYSIKDAITNTIALFCAQILGTILIIFFLYNRMETIIIPRSVFFLDFFITLFFTVGLRSSKRLFLLYFNPGHTIENNVIIYGAGDGGEQILRDMQKGASIYNPVAIIDDDKSKLHSRIHGVLVQGDIHSIGRLSEKYNARTVVIAIPSMRKNRLQWVYDYLTEKNIKDIKILPPIDEVLGEQITVKNLKSLDITDLIGREIVDIDMGLLGNYLENKTILVTGAGGSIGSELVNQIARFNVDKIIALDIDETELFYLKNDMLEKHNKNIITYLCDIKDRDSLTDLFDRYSIDIIYHAAALKHVPICEEFPSEAVKTNILGTYNILNECNNKVERFILISTDKAVNPTSIMGGTKRICEFMIQAFSYNSKTKFTAVRFGNVLGSRGSVIPIFKNQIESGGPVTVTHPEMRRYFMTIPEAVLLVIESGGVARGGEIFILDMGEPVYIKDIAERMIRMYGLEPYEDIDIIYSGKRPGEKLFEELLVAEEGSSKTRFDKIFKANTSDIPDKKTMESIIEEFRGLKSYGDIIRLLKGNIKTFNNEKN